MTGPAAVVWFKRDLRVRDHAPLAEAVYFERAVGLVVIEPEWLASPECDPRHVSFLLRCVGELQRDLARLGLPLRVRIGSAIEVLESLRREFGFTHLLSHEETGPAGAMRATWRWAAGAGPAACGGRSGSRRAWCDGCDPAPAGRHSGLSG